jgi:hypothetical protein
MEVKSESDWYVCFPLNMDLDDLKQWAHSIMKESPGKPTVTGEHDTGVWWLEPTPAQLKARLEEIAELNDEWGTSIWEFGDGGPLHKHSDGQGRGTTFIIILEGRFEITTYHEKFPDRALGSFQYGPGDIFVLKNGHKKFHGGRCLDGYRLALAVYTKHETCPFRDHSANFKAWWGDSQ